MSRRYTYAVCRWCGERRPPHSHIHIDRPHGPVSHGWRKCPFHRLVEWVSMRDEEWYGRYYTWECGTTAMSGEGWRLPPSVTRREWKAIDRERRPEHYEKYDRRRGAHGRFTAAAPAPVEDTKP